MIQKKYLFEHLFIHSLVVVTEDCIEQMKSHKRTWGFLYKFDELSEKTELPTHCMHFQLTLSEVQQSDFNGVDLANELIHLRQILPEEYKTPKYVLQYILETDIKDFFSNV